MITKENGLRYAKLIHVSVDNGKTGNSNKVYIMEEQADGRIRCDYGRVGKEMKVEYKDRGKWDATYKQKLSTTKGYKDVTSLMVEPVVSATGGKTIDISDTEVKKLMNDILNYANQSIQKNYKVTQEAVSPQQVDAAQEIINNINKLLGKKGQDIKEVNDQLIELYMTIPRKMRDVRDHLVSSIAEAKKLIASEQDTLDTMAGQVQLIQQKAAVGANTNDVTILEQMGITIDVESDKTTLELINKLLGSNKSQVNRIFKVNNPKTKKKFDDHHEKCSIKKKRLYWHGTRNENLFNILQSGLLIRPSGAVHTGSMFGDGIYFADKAQKSVGYSSLRGSYWSKGSSNKGFLMLFEVSVGKQKEILHHNSSCYSLSEKVLQKEGFDTVFAKGGADLRNNEYIVYNAKHCTITHLIELNG